MPRDQAPAASTTTSAATLTPSARTTPSARPPTIEISLTGVCSWMVAPAASAAIAQAGRELAVVDLMVLRAPHRAGELAGEMRLAPARLGGGNPLQRQAELLLMRKMMMDARLIVGGERDDQRAFRAQFDVDRRTPSAIRRRKAGQRAWLSRPSATSASSPGSASQQAASMPAAAWLAPLPAAPRSNTSTVAPWAASRQAMPSPITPAPMMATLGDLPKRAEPDVKRLLPSLA